MKSSISTGKSRSLNDTEEDAFDPGSLQEDTDTDTDTDMNIGIVDIDIDNTDTSSLSLKQIRDLKSKRALQRVAAGAVDGFDGGEEEEGDECYSLLQQDDDDDDEGQQGQDKGKEGFDLNGNQSTNKNNNNNNNSEKQKQEACPIEPFNMTSEREDGSGYFDGDTYVFRRGNPDEEEDAWLDQLDDKETSSSNINVNVNVNVKKQSSIATTTTSNTNANTNANAARDAHTRAMNEMTKEQIYDELIPLLATDSESILQALGRYGSIIKRETKQLKLLRKKQAKDQTLESQSQSQSQSQSRSHSHSQMQPKPQNANIKKETSASTKALNRLTELSNVCMMKYDDTAIYDRDRAYFTNILGISDANEAMKRKRSYFSGADANVDVDVDADADVDAGMNDVDHGVAAKRSRGEADADNDTDADTRKDNDAATNINTHASKDIQWEYRGNEDNAIHGPYKTQEMMEWIKAGYFVGPMAVDVRMISRDAVDTNDINGCKDEPASKSKEEVVDDLLGDLEDSDDENDNEGETGIDSAIASEWQRSDEIDFSKYQ